MKRKYLPKTTGGKLARLGEECAEVATAVSKTLRVALEEDFDIEDALEGGNPEIVKKDRETNRDWILREIKDLKHAIAQVEKAIS